ncbi:Alpha/beta hydrolase fold-1 [Mycena galopus ATCC 62051]|nr:Alpha/beta hydrolase fold-1 [Mycena galopus ATCC 62051]
MASTTKSTFVLVPGTIHTASHFQPLVDALHAKGHPTEVISHPSIGALAATVPLGADVVNFRRVLEELINDRGKDVIIFGHSYGGFIASQTKGLERSVRAKAGQKWGVVKVIYLSANLPLDGETTFQVVTKLEIPVGQWTDFDPVAGTITANSLAAENLYHDLPDDQAKHWVSELKPMAGNALVAVVASEVLPWDADVPKVYIFCKRDRVIPLDGQQRMLERVQRHNKENWSTYEIECGHSPFLSHVEELAEILTKA